MVVVFDIRFDFFTMPKAEKLSTKRSAVLARERREREKKDNEYNATLKEFLQFKYNHIIAEFNPFYENMMTHRPANLIYTNTNEFRLWQKREIEKAFSPSNDREEQAEQRQDEQLPELLTEQQQQQDEQLPELLPEQQQQQQQQDEQLPDLGQLVNELVGEVAEIVGDHDEGIALDIWEELQGDIEDFYYRLEVELDQYMQ